MTFLRRLFVTTKEIMTDRAVPFWDRAERVWAIAEVLALIATEQVRWSIVVAAKSKREKSS